MSARALLAGRARRARQWPGRLLARHDDLLGWLGGCLATGAMLAAAFGVLAWCGWVVASRGGAL